MSNKGLTPEELQAESAVALPDKEVVSILDLNADIDIAIDAASPIDLAAAANLNVAAPIDAAASANLLSSGSSAAASVDQGAIITQTLGTDDNPIEANATSIQVSDIGQGEEPVDGGTAPPPTDGTGDGDATVDTSTGGLLDGDLLNVNVNVDLDTDLAAPIAGAVAANANVAAPISASVAANVASVDSDAIAVSEQDALINQTIVGSANATADQDSSIAQGEATDGGSTDSGGTSGGDSGGTSAG